MVTPHGTSKPKRQDAPGDLETVRRFINTWDAELGTDTLATPEGVIAWLTAEQLVVQPPTITEAARLQTVQVREALRALARGNTGSPIPLTEILVLNDAADRAQATLHFTPAGHPEIAPRTPDALSHAIGRILTTVTVATLNGTWNRLKICSAEDCRWAFYDHSRNRSGVWCQMAECGNRAKVRSHRQRSRSTGP